MELIQKYCCSIVPLYFIEHFDFIWLKMFTSSQQGFRFLLAVTVSYRRFISVAQRTFRNFVFPSKIFDANVCAERRSFVKLAADSVVTILIEFTLKWSEIVAIDEREDESFWTAFTYTITSAIVASVAVAVALAIYNWNWIGGGRKWWLVVTIIIIINNNCVAYEGWVPGSSGGGFHFHYRQTPRNPAMCPHTRRQAPVTLTGSVEDRGQNFNIKKTNTLSTLQWLLSAVLQWATLATLLRHADVCLRLLDPLETADLWLLSHLTNMQLFVVNLLKFHLTTFIIINNINILVIMVKWTRDTGLLQKKEPLLLKKKPTTYHQNLYPNIHQKYTDQP